MTDQHIGGVALPALDGANPLGFLAALGTLVALRRAGESGARMSWLRGATWTPTIIGVSAADRSMFSALVARGLGGRAVPASATAERLDASKRYREAKTAAKKKAEELRKRGLRGAERKSAREMELAPLEAEVERARDAWLRALREAVPRPELALGDRIDCTAEEYRLLVESLLTGHDEVDGLPMLAAFGTDACLTDDGKIEPTPFQFLRGAGDQWFLKTALELMTRIEPEAIERALFEPWTYSDAKLSMRWDPTEDRRYALLAEDPAGQPTRTVWMANLLAYRALALFPAVPRRGALRVVGWAEIDGDTSFTWPLWEVPASLDAIRSLLAIRELAPDRLDRDRLRARGIPAVFRSRRIKVGSGTNQVINFTPARSV